MQVCYFFSQNLVPNPSFEEFILCPSSIGQIYNSKDWYEPNICSADYFHTCNNNTLDVPENYLGFQNAKQGNAYVGIVVYNTADTNFREFIEVKLISQLVQGEKYCIEFYVSLTFNELYALNYAINSIGCLLTTDSFLIDSCNQEIFLIPQIENAQGIITDTMNWVVISGEFVANGGEQFLSIGNFRNDSNTSVLLIDSTAPNSYYAYYYIDAISVTLCDTTAIVENKNEKAAIGKIYPNPNTGEFSLKYQLGRKEKGELQIFDLNGKLLHKQFLPQNKNQIELNHLKLNAGVYLYCITLNEIPILNQKLIVIQ